MGLPMSRPSDPVARARLLAQIREAVLSGSPAPQQPRPVVSESWRRSLAARVDPDGAGPPMVYDRGETVEIRSAHPLAETLPVLRETLVSIADEAMHMMIITDSAGHILWREGQAGVLRRADRVGLIEGTRWSEDVIGTNAMGTAIAEDAPVQIHSAEHLVRTYHAWTCAASPVHDPDTGRLVGVVDVTGPVRGFHPSTMALVGAAAKLAEGVLRARMRARDELLRKRTMAALNALRGEYGALITRSGRVLACAPHDWLPEPRLELTGRAPGSVLAGGVTASPATGMGIPPGTGTVTLPDGRTAVLEPLGEGYLLRVRTPSRPAAPLSPLPAAASATRRRLLRLRFLGTEQPTAALDDIPPQRLSRRHADMLTLLALHPIGVSAEALATGVYGDRGNPVTARAEIHRLRNHLGAGVVRSAPYRLHAEVDADFLTVRDELRAGRVRAAAAAYRGALRPGSEAPTVIEERQLLAGTLRRAVLDSEDAEAMWALAEVDSGADDVELAERLAATLPTTDPRHATMVARAERLTRD